MIGPLLLLAGVVLLASQKKRSAGARAPLEQEAERIVRESKEIIHGTRDSYSDPGDTP